MSVEFGDIYQRDGQMVLMYLGYADTPITLADNFEAGPMTLVLSKDNDDLPGAWPFGNTAVCWNIGDERKLNAR